MKKKKIIYRKRVVSSFKADFYRNNGCLAIILEFEDGDSEVITTNLCSPLQSDTLAFLDTNNHPKIESFIKRNGLGLPMGYTERSGFCEYPLYTIFKNQLS